MVTVVEAKASDLGSIAEIGSEAFSGLRPAERGLEWVTACFSARPRMRYWVAKDEGGTVQGYILWMEKGGFRSEAVIELEQIAVRSTFRRRGIGRELVLSSLKEVEDGLRRRGARLKLIEVTTGSEQNALQFYKETLGAEPVAKIQDFFRGDEHVLVARKDHHARRS